MSLTALVLFAVCLTATAENRNALNEIIFSGDFEFIDLTHPFDNQTIYWPGVQNFVFTRKIANLEPDGSWYAANEFAAGEHGGTHLDAPYHFYRQGLRAGELPLDSLIVPLIIVDISSRVNDDPNFVLYKIHLDYMLNAEQKCIIIFKFGWSKFYNDKQKYLGMTDNGKLNFPGLSEEIATWITTSYKKVVGIGVDVASVDPGSSQDYPVHKVASSAGLYNIENVNLSRDIPEYGCTAIVLPMKIRQGTGAPVRFVAICPKKH
ncbi:uncharacterized protein LOC114360175 [Ostrinia furnacalis]|uniref:uncharacterized protein LOC114360175 n=1 Tax=Ostrinia furnacalis TaxID=93504 RepID=UPI00103F0D6F|nr:uncharacterized protein LOC114360175 [Ostrinia furnacalis]